MKKSVKEKLQARLNKAIEPPRAPKPDESDALISLYAPLKGEPPSESAAPPKSGSQPLRIGGAAVFAAPPKIVAPPIFVLPQRTPHTRVPNEIFDRVMPTLEPAQQVILWRLYRLSAGFDSLRCRVSLPKLSAMINVKPTQLRIHLKILEERGLIRRLSVDLANKNQGERGIEFEVRLPRLASWESAALPKTAPPSIIVAPSEIEPNKLNTQKETHTNTEGVRVVGSRFSLVKCRKYAEHLKATGQGINNPGGYATKIHRSGEADELIEAFLNPPPALASVDASKCPDCQGTGWWYPQGREAGAARCQHKRLAGEKGGE